MPTTIDPFRLFDTGFKTALAVANFSAATSTNLLVLIPFALNATAACLYAHITADQNHPPTRTLVLATALSFEPLTMSLLLSGHFTFLPAIAILGCHWMTKARLLLQILIFIGVSSINPYLSPLMQIYFLYRLLLAKDKTASVGLFIVFVPAIVSVALTHIFDLSLIEIMYDTSAGDRTLKSGIFPANLLIPDPVSAPFIPIEIKNAAYWYLNVPESNYFVGFFILYFGTISLSQKRIHIKPLLFFGALYLFYSFPPSTTISGVTIYFPSFVTFDVLQPEYKVISRTACLINIVLLHFLLDRLKRPSASWVIWLLVILTLPKSLPSWEPSSLIERQGDCGRSYHIASEWNSYYCRQISECSINVAPTLSSNLTFEVCRVPPPTDN